MRTIWILAGLLVVGSAGCGGNSSSPQPLTPEQRARYEKEQKQIEDEERGTPIKAPKGGRK